MPLRQDQDCTIFTCDMQYILQCAVAYVPRVRVRVHQRLSYAAYMQCSAGAGIEAGECTTYVRVDKDNFPEGRGGFLLECCSWRGFRLFYHLRYPRDSDFAREV